MNRTQIYLTEDQHDALAQMAQERQTTASGLIRDAIDGYLAAHARPEQRLRHLRELGARLGSAAVGSDPVARGSAATVDSLRAHDLSRISSTP
jgi:hypothetical protein